MQRSFAWLKEGLESLFQALLASIGAHFPCFHAGYKLIEGSCRLVRLNAAPFPLGRFEVAGLKSFGDLEELRLPGANLSGELQAGGVELSEALRAFPSRWRASLVRFKVLLVPFG